MNYILKQFDEPLVKFSATTDTSVDPQAARQAAIAQALARARAMRKPTPR